MHIKAWAGSMMFLEITDICSFTSPVSTWPFKSLTYWDRYFIFIFIYVDIHEPLIPRRMKLSLRQVLWTRPECILNKLRSHPKLITLENAIMQCGQTVTAVEKDL